MRTQEQSQIKFLWTLAMIQEKSNDFTYAGLPSNNKTLRGPMYVISIQFLDDF